LADYEDDLTFSKRPSLTSKGRAGKLPAWIADYERIDSAVCGRSALMRKDTIPSLP